MQSQIFNLNWDTFDFGNREQQKQLMGALQVYMSLPNKFIPARFAKVEEFIKAHKAFRERQIQAFSIPSDFPVNERAIDVVSKFQIAPAYDNGYEQIYNVLNFENSRASGFDVMDMASGLAFRETKIGEKLKVYQMAGEKQRCYFCFYGGALGWHRSLFEDQDYWVAENNAIEFRNKAYGHRASVFYGLLDAAADLKGCCSRVPVDCSGCDANAKQIAMSLNFMANEILRNVANKGYGTTPNEQLIVLADYSMVGRLREALAVRLQQFSESPTISAWNFRLISTGMLTNPNRVFVILPRRKILAGYRMDLTLFDDFDILSYTDTVAGWMRYGGCIGDLEQIECVEFATVSGSCPPSPDSGLPLHVCEPGNSGFPGGRGQGQ